MKVSKIYFKNYYSTLASLDNSDYYRITKTNNPPTKIHDIAGVNHAVSNVTNSKTKKLLDTDVFFSQLFSSLK